MGRHEVHIYVHVGEGQEAFQESAPETPYTRVPVNTTRSEPRPPFDLEGARAETFWRQHLSSLFIKAFPIWDHFTGAWKDSMTGTNDSMGLDLDEGYYDHEMRKKFKAAHGLHVNKERLTDVMVRKGLHLANQKGYKEDEMLIYIEDRVRLYANTLGLNAHNTSQLVARIHQPSMKLAS